MDYQFPEGFLWEGTSSGPRSEGGGTEGDRVMSGWGYWFSEEPGRFYRQVKPSATSDFYHKYPGYTRKVKAASIKSYCTPIQWNRVIHNYDRAISEDGIQFYNQVTDELIRDGIEPVIYLYHSDLPLCWVEKSGLENRGTVYAFVRFAAVCPGRSGNQVKYWAAFNESIIIPEAGYPHQKYYLAVCDVEKAAAVGYHVQLVSSLVVAKFRKSGCNGKVGVIVNLAPTYCEDPEKAKGRRTAEILDLIFNRSFLDPSVKGEYPVELKELPEAEGTLPEVSEGDRGMVWESTVGYLGVNCYCPGQARMRTTAYERLPMPKGYYKPYGFEGQKMSTSRGWEVYESTVYDIAIDLKENCRNIPWYISENGIGIQDEGQFMEAGGMVEGDCRIELTKEHLTYPHKAMKEDCSCFRYHLWSPFDCWSWTSAHKNRYRLLRTNVYDGYKVTMRKSAH